MNDKVALARVNAAQSALDGIEMDQRLLMAAKAIQIMQGQNDDGSYKISADMALAAAMYQAGTGQLVGRDFYVNDKVGRMEGYRGAARDASDRGAGELSLAYRAMTDKEIAEHDVHPGDVASVCEVTQIRALALAQVHGIPYHPVTGYGIIRELEKFTNTDDWKEGRNQNTGKTYRYKAGFKPRDQWKPIILEGGMTWKKKADNRAYKDALRHVPGALASPDEVIEQAVMDYGIETPPEGAHITIEQAQDWVESERMGAEVKATMTPAKAAASLDAAALEAQFDAWAFDDRPCPHCATPRNERHFEDCAFKTIKPKMPTRQRPAEEVSEGQFRPAAEAPATPGNGHEQDSQPEQIKSKPNRAAIKTPNFGAAFLTLLKKLDEAAVPHDYRRKDGGVDYDHAQYSIGALGFTEITAANLSAVIAALEKHIVDKAQATEPGELFPQEA